MQLEDVKTVNAVIRARPATMARMEGAGRNPPRFTLGIGLTEREDDYRVAVRVENDEEKAWFQSHYADLIEQHGDNIEIKIVGKGSLLQSSVSDSSDSETVALQIGSRVRHVDGLPGTLGFFAYRNGKLGIVSCNHVLARSNDAKAGDEIVADASGKVIAQLSNFEGFSAPPKADCAFAELVDEKLAPEEPGRVNGTKLVAGIPRLRNTLPVTKVGAKTGVTHGIVKAFNVPLDVDYGRFFVHFEDLIEIESVDLGLEALTLPFAVDGDSGSVAFSDEDSTPVGMLFYKKTGGPGNSGILYANPIPSIVSALGVRIAL